MEGGREGRKEVLAHGMHWPVVKQSITTTTVLSQGGGGGREGGEGGREGGSVSARHALAISQTVDKITFLLLKGRDRRERRKLYVSVRTREKDDG